MVAVPLMAGEATKPSRIRMPGHGALVLNVPVTWKVSAVRPAGDLPPTIHFDPAAAGDFSVQITPVWRASAAPEPPDSSKLKKMVELARDEIVAQSTTRDVPVRELSAGPVNGYYFSAIDKKSKGKPGDWRYLTQGSALFEDLVLAFTVLSNDPQQPEAAATFEMFKTLQREPESPEVKVALPDKSWALVLDLPGFELHGSEVRPDGSGAMMEGSNRKSGLVASAYIEREEKIDSLEACKKKYWGKSSGGPLAKTDVREVTKPDMIAVHYMVPEFGGLQVRQQNINAYLYRDGTCIDIHLSKAQYTPEDEALFDAVLASVRFADK